MKKTTILLLSLLMYASCVEEYNVSKGITDNHESSLVIQGQILSGDNSIVYLNNTAPFGQINRPEAILNANIYVIGQNGFQSEKAAFDIENDRYVIPTYDLPNNTQYAIKVELDGETYQSIFQPIQPAKEIDEVYYIEGENDLTIRISSHGNVNESPYYMWTYEEDWEVHPSIDISKALNTGYWKYSESIYADLEIGKHNPYYNCWGHDKSEMIHIYNASNLSDNSIKGYNLLSIPLDDARVSYLYSILVKQASLNEETYEYFRLQKLYSEESGGIFTPMPTEIKGNVSCISNPEIKVHGYVLASQITTHRIFIDATDLFQTDLLNLCSSVMGLKNPTWEQHVKWTNEWQKEMRDNGAILWHENKENLFTETSVLYTRICADCRIFPNATKKRPDFWPNNHE